MTPSEFKALPKRQVGDILMDISDIDDQSDRTLFHAYVNYLGKRVIHHSYVKNCCLHVVLHTIDHQLLAHISARELSALVLVPKALLQPAMSDYQASEFFLTSGADVRFVCDYQPVERLPFVGYVLEELEDLHLKMHSDKSLQDIKSLRVHDLLEQVSETL
ncbi:MAG: hypothetical protein RSG77_25725 [Hafnia sp.]